MCMLFALCISKLNADMLLLQVLDTQVAAAHHCTTVLIFFKSSLTSSPLLLTSQYEHFSFPSAPRMILHHSLIHKNV